MLRKHITIELLTIIQIYHLHNIPAYKCAKYIKIGKDRVYAYYNFFGQGMTVGEIYEKYKVNRLKCGCKKIILSEEKIEKINEQLDSDWSIDAICGRDKKLGESEKCSTKTLYRMVKDGILDYRKLRRKGKRKPNNHEETRGKINDCKTIHERDETYPDINKLNEFGHFEGDTIVGKGKKSAIVTLVDIYSKYIVLIKASRKSKDVLEGIKKWFKVVNVKTITFDRGKEFSRWLDMESESSAKIYFSDPGSPGQRGLNENSNGIVRKDLPKSTDLSKYSQYELNIIASKWNSIPRKSLDYFTSQEILEMSTGRKHILPVV